MIISIASGKGGTGKTTVATNLALSLNNVQLLDCDVEQPNSHLFINPIFESTETITTPVPNIDEKKCNGCGKCSEICQFNAIAVIGDTTMAFPELCHSCGGCMEVCPEHAITETFRELGIIQKGYQDGVMFIHGKLRVGEAMSPPLIKKVRSMSDPDKITIIDAPPGTSCPVIASIKGADFVVLVTEPTPFGLHDLKLAVEAVKILNIPRGLVINRADIGDDKVLSYAEEENLPILMKIPFDRQIAESYSKGEAIARLSLSWKEKFRDLYEKIKRIVNPTS